MAKSKSKTPSKLTKRDIKGNPRNSSATTQLIQRGDAKNDIVRLNVGGTRYEVSRDTIMRHEGSMLASLISGKWKEGDGEDEIFIDRDGHRFGYILDYLRSDRVYLSDLSDQSALMEEFEYFGIDADISKVFAKDDYVSIHELAQEIKAAEATIGQKKKKIAAIKESHRVAGEFSNRAETQSLYLRHNIKGDIDKEVLRGCFLSRGLYVVSYSSSESGGHTVDLCTVGLKGKYVKTT